MGKIKIVEKGLELEGTALLIDKMKTSHIKARYVEVLKYLLYTIKKIFFLFLPRPGEPMTFGNPIMFHVLYFTIH